VGIVKLHARFGGLAIVVIGVFFGATVVVELFGTHEQVALVKLRILQTIPLLVLLLAGAGIMGNRVGAGWTDPLVAAKRRRMAFAAINGLALLIPSAVLLARWSAAGRFDTMFYAVQAVELLAGGTNIVLLSRNALAGLQLRRASHPA
jgi:hypothetical protein